VNVAYVSDRCFRHDHQLTLLPGACINKQYFYDSKGLRYKEVAVTVSPFALVQYLQAKLELTQMETFTRVGS
jgi:hypothetical protein